MNYLAVLHDKDIFSQPEYATPNHYEKRTTVKAIIKNKNGEYGFITNSIHGLYLLAGGGSDSQCLEKEIKRECIEETGYNTKITKEVGRILEFRNRDAKEYQTVCFLSEPREKTSEDLRTEDERANNLSFVWLQEDFARKTLKEQVEKVRSGRVKFYNTAFNAVRDQIFFEEIFKK